MEDRFLVELSLLVMMALGCGLLFEYFKQPAILGYILAGTLLGPSVLGFASDASYITLLAELGVQMLLYVIGMELKLKEFQKVWSIALGAALTQLAAIFLAVYIGGSIFGLSTQMIVVLGASVGFSSTAVAINMLNRIDQLTTQVGRLSVGILIAQDLVVIPVIIMLRQWGENAGYASLLGKMAIAMGVLWGVVRLFREGGTWRLGALDTLAKNAELSPLAGLAFCFTCAALSGLVGLSAAYGAFIGGLIIGNSSQSHALFKVIQPVQSILMAVFFLSIGLLLDVRFIFDNWNLLLFALFAVASIKTFVNVISLRLFGQTWKTAFVSGIALSQMGEFGFLMATIGAQESLISPYGKKMILTLVALSLVFSPYWVRSLRRLKKLTKATLDANEIMCEVYTQELNFFQSCHQHLRQKLKTQAGAGEKKITRLKSSKEPSLIDESASDA
ncbi:MAG: cation:proton antiporter [Alphaproteobacteria bacterium]|nr:MAG: cation:proton antiporter [Alphaproteobacteria bacterium]